ncbi:unnamed protein product [Linum trigynum]|uniref:Uncharacterized protein n=1 Tax=Linum trigynum TaxID=586398 RepID=A0AAV2FFI4_9ROSI
MAETIPTKSHSATEGKHPNFIEKAKEKIDKVIHSPKHTKETHGTSNDIDEKTDIDEVRGPGVFQRAKEEIEALVETIHHKKEKAGNHSPTHTKETHGTSDDIDEKTSIDEVRGPGVFQRAKEEIEALVETIHHKKDKAGDHSPTHTKETHKKDKAGNYSPTHTKETHGTSDDIDEFTSVDEVKGPGVFQRAKEEIEALVETIHPKKEKDHHKSSST